MRVSAAVKSRRPHNVKSSDEDIFASVRLFMRLLEAVNSYEVRLDSHPLPSLVRAAPQCRALPSDDQSAQ